jgi:hypothetical protein
MTMPLTEQELRHQLEQAADQALPPRLAVADVAGRIRRRRARRVWGVSGSIAVIGAVAVAVPVGLDSTGRPTVATESLPPGAKPPALPGQEKVIGRAGSGPQSRPAPPLRPLLFAVTVNGRRPIRPIVAQAPPKGCGRSPADPCPASLGPGFFVTPGERLSLRVVVTVPARARISGLWLGISSGTFGFSDAGPVGLAPILAHLRADLAPGQHAVELAWTVPAGTARGTVIWLAASWTGMLPIAGAGGSQQPLTSASVSAAITAFVTR